MQMEAGLDTGPVRAEGKLPITGQTAGELTTELADLGARLMVEVLADLPGHPARLQDSEGLTYARKIDKAETRLSFVHDAETTERQIRAFAPAPGAWFELEGERYRVLAAEVVNRNGAAGTTIDDDLTIACGFGAIRPTLIQRAGRPVMDRAALLRGRPVLGGTSLT